MGEHELPKVIDKQPRDDLQVPENPAVKVAQDTWTKDNADFKDCRSFTAGKCLQPMDLHNDLIQNDKLQELRKRFDPAPTEKERAKAEDELNSHVSALIPEGDRVQLAAINHAIVTGDGKELATALKNTSPDKLETYLKEINNNLDECHAGMNFALTEDGKVLAYRDRGRKALQIDPVGGQVESAHAIRELRNGDVILAGEVVNADLTKVASGIFDATVDQINGPAEKRIPIDWPPERQWPDWPHRIPRDWPPYDRLPPWLNHRYLQSFNADPAATVDLSRSPYVLGAADLSADTRYDTGY